MTTKALTEKEREKLIKDSVKHYERFMDIAFPNWRTDPNMQDTPHRVVKAYVNELCVSLYSDGPKITTFENVDKYDGIVLQSNIDVKSLCSHHFQNIHGVAHVAYIPSADGKIIGLSKLNRIVDYFARRPQVQENLTMQIHDYVNELCEGNQGVAVLIKAKHMCCSHRGINHDSDMQTVKLSGAFFANTDGCRDELYNLINYATKK